MAGQGAWLGFDYRTFFSTQRPYMLGQVAMPPEPNHVSMASQRIGEYVHSLNSAIEHENKTFTDKVRLIVTGKQDTVRAKDRSLDALSVGSPHKHGLPFTQFAPESSYP